MLKKIRRIIRKLKKKSRHGFISGDASISGRITIGGNQPLDTRIEKKPIEVVDEIVAEIPRIDLTNLSEQLRMVKKRKRYLQNIGMPTNDEDMAILYLQARKKFRKYDEKLTWTVTTNKQIKKLCEKYKLVKVSLRGYVRCIPTEALEELEKFLDVYEKITDAEPNIELIIDDGGEETRKDPIMLVESPVGAWWYIIGAWDKEVEYMDELVYNGH